MNRKSKPSSVGRKFIGMLRNAIEREDRDALGAICHHLPIPRPGDGPPAVFRVYLSPNTNGSYLATCRELPDVAAIGETEEDALELAQGAIEEALGARRSSPDFPY